MNDFIIKPQDVQRSDIQGIGINFYRGAVKELIQSNPKKAYVLFKQGMDFLDCDCNDAKWLDEFSEFFSREDIKSFYAQPLATISDEDAFVYAYIFTYLNREIFKEFEEYNIEAISIYLDRNKACQYGHFVKAKLIGNYQGVDQELNYIRGTGAIRYSKPSTMLFRMGLFDKSMKGFEILLGCLKSNSSCPCTIRNIYKRFHEKTTSDGYNIGYKEKSIEGFKEIFSNYLNNLTYFRVDKNDKKLIEQRWKQTLLANFLKPNNLNNFERLYKETLEGLGNLSFPYLKLHPEPYISCLFNFIEEMNKLAEKKIRQIAYSEVRSSDREPKRRKADSIDYEEEVMRALRNGQGDKYGL